MTNPGEDQGFNSNFDKIPVKGDGDLTDKQKQQLRKTLLSQTQTRELPTLK
ncbi:hypothetical protein HMPREF0974_00418 [Lactobacillus jensenii 115-3-CHN]|nr:hypothetical protein HMPREF0974_00418 [Lactobacillus jensenii 115-3-CHN]